MTDPVEEDLLAAIAADPDALEPRLVYGDYLQAKADPRGELIAVQVGLRAKPDDLQLLARQRELTTELTRRLFEGTPLDPSLVGRWHLGFVDRLSLDARTIRILRTTHRAWFAQPSFACVRDVAIDSKYARTLRAIGQLGLGAARRLCFGELGDPLQAPTLAAIATRLPRLTALHLRGAEVPDLSPLYTLKLRELTLQVTRIGDGAIARIAATPWQLEAFGLQTTDNIPPDIHSVLATLYTGTHLPTVKHFTVAGGVPVATVIQTLAASKRAATVETVTGDFQRATHDDMVQVEPHRQTLAHVKFQPVLGQSDYYDVEGVVAVGSFLNYRLDRPADALPHYERALQLKPEHAIARQNLGIALRKLRRLDESLVAFDMVIAQARRPTAAMYNGRHYTLCELGRRVDAVADLEQAVALEPSFADAWNNLGVERQYAGDVDGAFAAFQRCTQLMPQHDYGLRNEGDLLLELGRTREALQIYERLRAARGDSNPLLAVMAHARLETGDALGTRLLIDTLLRDLTQVPDLRLYLLRGLALHALEDRAGALADLEHLANTTNNPAWYALTLFVRAFDDRTVWPVPDAAITPRAITDAVIARPRPATAKALGEASIDDQIDCSELAIMSALRAGNRTLAIQRAQAAATLYVEQGPRYFRKWWQTLATVAAVTRRELADEPRALLTMVMRALRGRHRIADVMVLAS